MIAKSDILILGFILSATSILGCSGLNSECGDGLDNDGDGLVDSYDPACNTTRLPPARCNDEKPGLLVQDPACEQSTRGAYESADPVCANRVDDDQDGLRDQDDPGCQNHLGQYTPAGTSEINPECSDGIDNDNDGLVDFFADPGCGGLPSGYAENIDPTCADGRDNDGDGHIDYPQDPGCEGPFDSSEQNPACTDGIDNDGDGHTDFPDDPDCLSLYQDREHGFACGDGVDNDLDGKVDYPDDLGCESHLDDTELNPACSDGRDNDGDGSADFGGVDSTGDGALNLAADSGCESFTDESEVNGVPTLCSDGIDNDGDGAADYPSDPDCDNELDDDESSANPCSDGIDNDGDGLIDTTTDTNHGDPACDAGLQTESPDPICGDGIDNDGDGRTDYLGIDANNDGLFDLPGESPPDPGCLTATDLAESPEPQCADGIDNDGDGTTDYPEDVACAIGASSDIEGMRGRNEAAPPQCADGIDNDGDGTIDFQPQFLTSGEANPNFGTGDAQCSDAFDNGEAT